MELKIHIFTTGRQYGPKPQRIAWAVVDTIEDGFTTDFRIAFVDSVRGISGDLLTWEDTNREVLVAYDAGGYTVSVPEVTKALQARLDSHEAALVASDHGRN